MYPWLFHLGYIDIVLLFLGQTKRVSLLEQGTVSG